MKKFKYFVSVLFFITYNTYSQDVISLESLINQALQNNYQLQISKINTQIAENQNTAGNAGMLPTIGVNGQANWDIKTSESNYFTGQSRVGSNAGSNSYNSVIQLDWTVFDGFAMFARRDRLGLLSEIGRTLTKFYIEQTILDLSQKYYSLVFQIALLENFKETIEISKFRRDLEKRKLELGSGNALQFNQSLIDFNSDSILLINIEVTIKALQIDICTLIQRDLDKSFFPADKTIIPNNILNYNDLCAMADSSNKELDNNKLEEMLREADYKINTAQRYPEIHLYSSYALSMQKSQIGFIESSNSYGPSFGMTVRFNLYDGGKQNIAVKNSDLLRESSELDTKDKKLQIKSGLLKMVDYYQRMTEIRKLVEKNLLTANKSVEIARKQLKAGIISGFDFRKIQENQLSIQNQLLELLYNLKLTELEINRISGNLVNNQNFSSF